MIFSPYPVYAGWGSFAKHHSSPKNDRMTIIDSINTQQPSGLRNFMAVHMQQHPFIFSDERKYRIQRHVAFWVFWWIFQALLYSFLSVSSVADYFRRLPISILESFLFMFNHIFLSYALMYIVIPRFLLRQRYWPTALWTIFFFFCTALLSTFMGLVVIPPIRDFIFGVPNAVSQRTTSTSFFLSLLAGLRGGITIGGIAAAIKLTKYWYMKEQRNLQLQKENIASQLQLLKAQIHPHFLFNTLNNIYSHTQNTSPTASKMVTGLSDMLRFILYECNQPLVPLSKELKMIEDYVNLERIRYDDKLELHLSFPEQTNDLQIAPLLLLPLVENCFKHGTSSMLEQPWLSLNISLENETLKMKLMNGKFPDKNEKFAESGIGLQNVKKRLELLYPGKHELIITSDIDVFIVNLKVQLEYKKDVVIKSVISESEPQHV